MTPGPDTDRRAEVDPWLARICAGTDMGDAVLRFDWAATSLGHPSNWSPGLRAAVGICLTARFPMLVVWGPELVKIYNDGYRCLLGSDKHPRSLGAPAKVIWPEIWDTIGPMFDQVLTTGRPTWAEQQLLVIERNGFREECYFLYSYSPLFDDDGSIGGVLDVVVETTAEVIAQRRTTCLSVLGAALFDAERVIDVCLRTATALTAFAADIRCAELHLLVGESPVLVAASRREDVASVDHEILRDVCQRGESVVLGGLAGDGMPAAHFVTPIGSPATAQGVLVVSLSPLRPFDELYREFLENLARAVSAALVTAYRRTVELGEYRRISDTLQAAMLRPASDLPTVAARYLPAEGNLAVGGDWYDVIDVGPDVRALVVGDCVGHGLDAATAMAQLRSAARAMLLEGHGPAAMLEALDRFAASVPDASCATVVCALFDRREGTVTYSRAGHPPPLVVGASGTEWLDGACGPPLAVNPLGRRTDVTRRLGRADMIVMYTDGLVERRGESIDKGLGRLAVAAAALRGASPQQAADALLGHLLPGGSSDDVVLVVKQLVDGRPS